MGTNAKKRIANIKQAVFVFVLLILAVVGAVLYQRESAEAGLLKCRFESAGGSRGPLLSLEIAATPQDRNRGLMFRKSLAQNHGMLFVYPSEQRVSFWMRETYVSLDMIFMDTAMKVVALLESVPINNEKARDPGRSSKYVVELAAGSAEKQGIREGSTLKCEGELPQGS
jgi:uncharacterized protein